MGLAADLPLRVKELQEAAGRVCDSLEARLAGLLQTSVEAQHRLAEETLAWESTRAALEERHEEMSARLTSIEERLGALTAELSALREAKRSAERGREEAPRRLPEQTHDKAALEHELETLRVPSRGESLPLRLLRLVRILPRSPVDGPRNPHEPSRGSRETVPTPLEVSKTTSEPYLLGVQNALVDEAHEPAGGGSEAHSFEMGVSTTGGKLGEHHVESTGVGNPDAPGTRLGDHELVNSVCLRCGIMEAYVKRYGAPCRPGEIFIPPGRPKSTRRR